jgi:flagellar basal-body rod protein FlgB
MDVTPSQFDALSRSLHAASVRHRVLSHNLANVNTPGYRRMDVQFSGLLDASSTDRGNIAEVEYRIVTDDSAVARGDGNSVDVDLELSEVNSNSLAAQTYIRILASKLEMMKTAITGQ